MTQAQLLGGKTVAKDILTDPDLDREALSLAAELEA